MLLIQTVMFKKIFGLIGRVSWYISGFSVACYLQSQRVHCFFLTWFPFASVFCSTSLFLSCVSVMIKYMSVRDDFGTPSWYRGDFWNVSVLWEKVTTEWPPGQFPSSFSSKRNKDYLKVGYIVLCQKKRRKFNLQTGGWECGLWFRIKVMQLP